MIVDSKIYEYFIVLEKYGNFSRAARELFITPQGLNGAVRRLEAELDVKLINTQSGSVTLTEHGESFLRHAHRMKEEIDMMRVEAVELKRRRANEIALGSAIGVLGYLSRSALDEFNESHTDAHVTLTEETTDYECEQRLMDGRYDFALLTEPVDKTHLVCIPICRDHQFCWVNIDNPLSRKKTMTVEDLVGQNVMTVGDDYKGTSLLKKLCAETEGEITFHYSSEMIQIFKHALHDEGIGITCRNHVADMESDKVVGIPFRCLPWGVSLCHVRDKELTAAETTFVEHMESRTLFYD